MTTSSGSGLDDIENSGAPAKVTPSQSDEASDKFSLGHGVYGSSSIDPVLAQKMALIDAATDEIGMTPWQWKLFFFNGFGYAVDSVSCISMI
jgi:hypothetical protein